MSDPLVPEPGSQPPSGAAAIYMVGADVDVCELADALRRGGFHVRQLDPHTLLEAVGVRRPSLVVLDVEHPAALEATRRLADVPGGSDIELLLLGQAPDTADASIDLPQCVGHFERPLEASHIVRAVRALVGARAGRLLAPEDDDAGELDDAQDSEEESGERLEQALGSNTELPSQRPTSAADSLPPSSLAPESEQEPLQQATGMLASSPGEWPTRPLGLRALAMREVSMEVSGVGDDGSAMPTPRPDADAPPSEVQVEEGSAPGSSGDTPSGTHAERAASWLATDAGQLAGVDEQDAAEASAREGSVEEEELVEEEEPIDDEGLGMQPQPQAASPLSVAPRWQTSSPPSSSSPPAPGSVWPVTMGHPGGSPLARGAFAGPTSISPDLEKLLVDAEERVFSEDVSSDVPSPEEEVDAILPPEVLAALDDPLEIGGADEAGEALSALTPVGVGTTGSHAADGGPQTVHRVQGTEAESVVGAQEPATSPGGEEDEEEELAGGFDGAGPFPPTPRPSPMGLQSGVGQPRAEGAPTVRNPQWPWAAAPQPVPQEARRLAPRVMAPSPTPEPRVDERDAMERDGEAPPTPEGAGWKERTPEPGLYPMAPIGEGVLRAGEAGWVAQVEGAAASLLGGMPIARGTVELRYAEQEEPVEPPPPPGHALPQVLTGSTDGLRVLGTCIGARLSASLCVEHGGTLCRAVMRDGDFVTCGSSDANESLVSFLVLRGDLPREVGAALAARIPPFGRHAAAALIANGFLSQDQLWPVLRAHAEWLLARLALMQRGTCSVEAHAPGRLRAEPAVFGGATGAEVLVEVAQRILPVDAAMARLGGAGAKLGPGPKRALLGECALTEEAREAVERAAGRSVEEVIEEVGQVEFASVLVALVALGVVEALPMIGPPAARAQTAGLDQLDAEAVRKRIGARLALIEEGDYFQLLGVQRSATSYEIRRAYLEARRAFEPSALLTSATADLADDLQLVLEVLEEAYDVLRDQPRRERYRRAIEATPPGS